MLLRVPSASVRRRFSASPARSLLDRVLGRSASRLQQPLSQPLPSPPLVSAPPLVSTQSQLTELPNGVRIITQETGLAAATVGLMFTAGTRHSPTPGLPQIIARLGLQSTPTRSELAATRALNEIGVFSINCQRSYLSFAMDLMPTDAGTALEIIGDVALNGKFEKDEVDACVRSYAKEIEYGVSKDSDILIQDAIHMAAYGNKNLAMPTHASVENVMQLNDPELLRKFRDASFVPGGMVVIGAGMEHARCVEDAEKLFGRLKQGPAPDNEEVDYIGGEVRLPAAPAGDGFMHVAIGFGCNGWRSDDVVPACALSILMGGGGSFSAGGPGKGMYSRLYTRVLNGNPWVNSALCTAFPQEQSTLFVIQGSSKPEDAERLWNTLVHEARQMRLGFTDEEVSRAKNQLRSSMYMNLEHRRIVFEDLGQQLLAHGCRVSADEICKKIDAITNEDLVRIARVLMDSNVALVVSGDTHSAVPTQKVITSLVKQ